MRDRRRDVWLTRTLAVVGLLAQPGCYEGVSQSGEIPPVEPEGSTGAEGTGGGGGGGDSGGGELPDDDVLGCALPQTRIWKLTPRQYEHTMQALLGNLELPIGDVKSTIARFAQRYYRNEADHADLNEGHAGALFRAAEFAASNPPPSLQCVLDEANAEGTCTQESFEAFASRAFRRPATQEEIAAILSVFDASLARGITVEDAMRDALSWVFMSPNLLFRMELGEATDTASEVTPLSRYERASALSYALFDGPPDEVLMTLAEYGALSSPDGVEEYVRTTLEEPGRARGLLRFYSEYSQAFLAHETGVDPAVYEEFSALGPDLVREQDEFVAHVFGEGDGRFETLMSAPYTVANPRLASLYGVQAPVEEGWGVVELPPDQRAGIITQGGFLVAGSKFDHGDPIRRGLLIRNRMFCQELPEPPKVPPIEESSGATMRESLSQHQSDPQCASCHMLTDLLGFPLEQYDAVVRFRTHEGEALIDPSGELVGAVPEASFANAVEMGEVIGTHPAARACFVKNAFHYVYGREPSTADACELERLQANFEEADGDMVELFVDMMTAEHFLTRRRG
ncbi:MAG: DUF1588 domain-containing protein [Nannocystales bacterium]